MVTAVCHYTAKCLVKRSVGEPDQWGEPTPIRLEGGSIGWTIGQSMNGTLSSYRRREREPVQPNLGEPSIFERHWEHRRLRSVTVTTAVSVDADKLDSGEFEPADIEELNRQAKRALLGKYPTPDDVDGQ